jgi:predicted RND superfamily exporter protein
MTNEEFIKILDLYKDSKTKSNGELTKAMDILTQTYDEIKTKIIDLTHYLDNVENIYNKILSEYNSRVKNGQ